MPASTAAVTGHVFRVERKRGPQWYMKFRLPNGKQVQRRIGPAWTSKREAAPDGYFTKRDLTSWGNLLQSLANQQKAQELATLPGLLLLAGRYEGVDERLIQSEIDECVSIGDYVLTGKTLLVDHGQGVFSAYFHLDTALVQKGDQVRPGRAIARAQLLRRITSGTPHQSFPRGAFGRSEAHDAAATDSGWRSAHLRRRARFVGIVARLSANQDRG